MFKIEKYRPFRINYKSKKDETIFEYRNKSVCIFFRNDWGWLNVPDCIYNRVWREIQTKGIIYYSRRELEKMASETDNGDELFYDLSKNCN
ncbi:unknown [Streptococcus phage M102AD]|uniref:hypothetical protein n=1 Tax=Streptococcus phage M102AD TaxID=1587907 RepID=UPI00022FA241|nr:hypothetical protein AVU37_gp34 [Streptococcus phage M102AD]ABD48937.1 unknown [Streptococcus phage M102AD]